MGAFIGTCKRKVDPNIQRYIFTLHSFFFKKTRLVNDMIVCVAVGFVVFAVHVSTAFTTLQVSLFLNKFRDKTPSPSFRSSIECFAGLHI